MPDVVDQAVQDTFLALWREPAAYRGGGDVAAFIWGIGIRRLIDAIRRESGARRRPPWRAAEPDVVVSAENQVLVGIEHGRLGQALAGLSPELRTAIEATVLDGLTCAEAARAARLRTVLALGRVEASLLARSLLVLAGLLVGGAVVWLSIGPAEPLWWNAAWRIGSGQLVLGMAVLAAAQLAAGRARRNAMAGLYASFPATASTRTLPTWPAWSGRRPPACC
jgi:hypothetical protein